MDFVDLAAALDRRVTVDRLEPGLRRSVQGLERLHFGSATPDDAPPGANRTPRDFHAVSQPGAALSTPITAMSGFGPKSQSHAAVSARHSGSARGRHVASAGGSSSTKRSYATWLTCMFGSGIAGGRPSGESSDQGREG